VKQLAALVLFATGMASAAPVTCMSVVLQDVTTIGSCSLGGLVFSEWKTQGSVVTLGGFGETIVHGHGDIFITFLVASPPAPTILVQYRVDVQESWMGLIGVDSSHDGVSTEIGEVVCDAKPVALGIGVCSAGHELANIVNYPYSDSGFAKASFAPHDTIWIQKTVGSTGVIPYFTNAQQWTTIPEPGSITLAGLGLFTMLALRYRAQRIGPSRCIASNTVSRQLR
jgi:hypothetical protein